MIYICRFCFVMSEPHEWFGCQFNSMTFRFVQRSESQFIKKIFSISTLHNPFLFINIKTILWWNFFFTIKSRLWKIWTKKIKKLVEYWWSTFRYKLQLTKIQYELAVKFWIRQFWTKTVVDTFLLLLLKYCHFHSTNFSFSFVRKLFLKLCSKRVNMLLFFFFFQILYKIYSNFVTDRN